MGIMDLAYQCGRPGGRLYKGGSVVALDYLFSFSSGTGFSI